MIEFGGRSILLDIEGTTSSIHFVYEVLFPYARRELAAFLAASWNHAEMDAVRAELAADAGCASFAEWQRANPAVAPPELVEAEALRAMDADRKTRGLKHLQGLIWERGYSEGVLRSQVYPDVPPALADWNSPRCGPLDVRIYSSGSAQAQRLFFRHTIAGDLSRLLRGYYDTAIGPKQSPASYAAISADMRCAPAEVLFLSDIPAELDAARAAGLQTGLVVRPGNRPVERSVHPAIGEFSEIAVRCGG